MLVGSTEITLEFSVAVGLTVAEMVETTGNGVPAHSSRTLPAEVTVLIPAMIPPEQVQ